MINKASIAKVFESKTFKKYFENTSWLFLERVLRMAVTIIVFAYVARYLGKDQYGQLSYAMAFVGLFTALKSLGIQNILIRELVKYPEKKHELMGTGFVLKLLGSLSVILVISVVFMFRDISTTDMWLVYIIAAGQIFESFFVIDFYYQSKVKSKYVVRVQLVQLLINAAIRISLIIFQAPLIYFAIATALQPTVLAIGLVYIYIKRGHRIFKLSFNKRLSMELLREAWPLAFYVLALEIQSKIDQVMIEEMLGYGEVGLYSAAYRMIESLAVIPVVIQSTFAPAITKGKMAGEEEYRIRRLNMYRFMFIVFLVIAIPTFFLAEWGIVLLLGEEFRGAGILLSLLSIRMMFTCMGLAKSNFITNVSLFKHTLFTAAVGCIVNIIMNYFMIPIFGSSGAIIATITSYSVYIFLLDFLFQSTRPNVILMLKGMLSFWKLNYKFTK